MAQDWNARVIEEFRANHGRVAQFEGRPLLLLHHRGAKSGADRLNPLVYLPVGDAFAVFGSKAGAPTNPDWYHNLVAHPSATVEVGKETFEVDAHVTTGAEHDQLFARQAALYPGFAEYQEKTDRVIPVVALTRKG